MLEEKIYRDKQTKNLEIDDLNQKYNYSIKSTFKFTLSNYFELPIDPVLAEDGFIYDCKAIESILAYVK